MSKTSPSQAARETRRKPRQVLAGGAAGSTWRVLSRVSGVCARGRRRPRRPSVARPHVRVQGGGAQKPRFWGGNGCFPGSPKSDKVLPSAGSSYPVTNSAPSQAARETRRESSSMLAGGAPGTVWDDSRCVPCGVARLGAPCGFPRCTASPQRALSEPSASPQQALSKPSASPQQGWGPHSVF